MIYICYGVTKSASTFLYQLTEEVFRVAHRVPTLLGPPYRPRKSVENYFDVIDPDLLRDVAAAAGDRDVVLKTHQCVHPEIAKRIEAGTVFASASIRDPRELALSMLDHGRRARSCGYVEFSEFHNLTDTLASLDFQIEQFRSWSALGRVHVFTYNEICFDTALVVQRIAAQIGVEFDAARVLQPFRSNREIGQFNKGTALRYREMTAEDQAVFLKRYAALYAEYSFDTPAAIRVNRAQRGNVMRAGGQFAQYLIELRRHIRF